MASSDQGSFITNPYDDDPQQAPDPGPWPAAEPSHVASPATQARQDELARRLLADREDYLENANASQTGSQMDRHLAERMGQHERELTDHQPVLPVTGSSSINQQGNRIRHVNFNGIYGRITQVEHVPIVTDGILTETATAPESRTSSHAPTWTWPSTIPPLTQPADGGESSLPHRTAPRRTQAVRDLRSQASSSSSTLRRRAAVDDLAQEGGYRSDAINDAEAHQATIENGEDADLRNQVPRHVTVADEEETPTLHNQVLQHATVANGERPPTLRNQGLQHAINGMEEPRPDPRTQAPQQAAVVDEQPRSGPRNQVPQQAAVQNDEPHHQVPDIRGIGEQLPLRLVNGNFTILNDDAQRPPGYGEQGQGPLDQPLPAHLDVNDPVGADFLAGMQHLRVAQDRIQTHTAGLGIRADDPEIQNIMTTLQASAESFTIGFQRAAAAADNDRRAHEETNDLYNRLRTVRRDLYVGFQDQADTIERLGRHADVLSGGNAYLEMRLAEIGVREAHYGREYLREAERARRLEGALRARRGENMRLLAEVQDMERVLYNYD